MSVFARIFSSRKVWIAIAGVVMCLLTVLGADPEKWTPLISAIVALSGVVIAAIGIEDGAAKLSCDFTSAVQDAKNDNSPGGNLPGKLPIILLFCSLLFVHGCAGTITPQSIDADQSRKTAVEPLIRDYVARHPAQEQTWEDFLAQWQHSIDARTAAVK